MSAYSSSNSVTIFTAIVYCRTDVNNQLEYTSFIIVSDELAHNKCSIYHYDKLLLEKSRDIFHWPVLKVHFGLMAQLPNSETVTTSQISSTFSARQPGVSLQLLMGKGLYMGLLVRLKVKSGVLFSGKRNCVQCQRLCYLSTMALSTDSNPLHLKGGHWGVSTACTCSLGRLQQST